MTELTGAHETRTVQDVQIYHFSTSVPDGGLAQMELLRFGPAPCRLTGLPAGSAR